MELKFLRSELAYFKEEVLSIAHQDFERVESGAK